MRFFLFGAIAVSCAAVNAAPAISGIYNAASWAPPGLTNSGVAQGSIFTVTGSGLGPSTLQQVESYPLPTTQGLGGTSISITSGGATTNCPMIYTSAGQVAAILPSATPVGTGTLTLSYQGASSSTSIQVLAANFGTFTLNEAGSGPGVVTDASYNPITYVNPAYPGETLIIWGTGLGAITGSETEPPAQTNLNTGVQVFVGGQSANVLYGGRGSSPGLDQINFVVPSGAFTKCRTSVAVLVNGVTGNLSTIAIAPAGQSTCDESNGLLSATNLESAMSSGSLSFGIVQMSRVGSENDELVSFFGSMPLNTLIRSYGGSFGPSKGSCTAYETTGSTLTLVDPTQPTYLDAGPNLVITGPGGSKTMPAISTGNYSATLATAPNNFIAPGSYSVTNGSGGADVGAFTWNVTLPSYIVPANLPASVSRAQNLTLNWTGGSAYSVVTIFLTSGLVSGASNSYVEIICNADASAGTFTIPAAIMNLLPTKGYGAVGVPGVSIQLAGYAFDEFTGAAAAGLNTGFAAVFVTSGRIATIE